MFYLQGISDAVHGALIQQHYMDIISNNLANVNTPGFKQDRLIFNDLMTRQVKTYFSQGNLRETENPLDLAIEGEGFFQVMAPGGTRLTRDGSFKMDANGNLVTSDGYQVLDQGGAPVVINPNGGKPVINEAGQVFQNSEQVGTIGVVKVPDQSALRKEGENLWAGENGATPATSPADGATVSQGSLEMSNVDTVTSMVNMISAFRGFESYQKAIHAFQEMDTKAATQVGRVA